MKYNRILRFTLFTCVSVLSMMAYGQNAPYSFGSLGILESPTLVQHQLMGGLSSTLGSKGDYAIINPASLHGLQETTLQTGSYANRIVQQTSTKRNTDFTGNFGYFSLGIPLSLKDKLGMSFSLLPYSNVDYDITTTADENGAEATNVFQGKGGLNQFNVGFGGELFNGFALGLSASVLFGNIESTWDKQFQNRDDLFSTRNTQKTYFNGFQWNAGVQYIVQMKESKELRIGLHGALASQMNTTTDEVLRTFNHRGEFFIDTISSRGDAEGSRELPLSYGGALSFGKKDIWMVGAEYNNALWSQVLQGSAENPFFDKQSFTLGGYLQLKGERDQQLAAFSDRLSNYLMTTRIYFGYKYENLYTGVVNELVTQNVFSLGLGLPIKTHRVYEMGSDKVELISRVMVGFDYTIRGNTEPGNVQENILGIKVGLTFNDKWFNKRKYQ